MAMAKARYSRLCPKALVAISLNRTRREFRRNPKDFQKRPSPGRAALSSPSATRHPTGGSQGRGRVAGARRCRSSGRMARQKLPWALVGARDRARHSRQCAMRAAPGLALLMQWRRARRRRCTARHRPPAGRRSVEAGAPTAPPRMPPKAAPVGKERSGVRAAGPPTGRAPAPEPSVKPLPDSRQSKRERPRPANDDQ